jgi:hypothetical protein
MGASLRRRVGLVVLALFVTVPLGRTACEVLCAPLSHAAAHGDALTTAGACHGPSETAAPVLTAAPAHACGDHAGSTVDVAVWLKSGRFTVDLRPLPWSSYHRAAERHTEPVVAAVPWGDPGPLLSSFTHASIASVVLRI